MADPLIGAKLSFVGVYMSAWLYGINTVFFFYILHLARQRSSKIEKKMVVASFFLFFLPSVHLWNGVHRSQLKFIDSQAVQVGDQAYDPNSVTWGVLFSSSAFAVDLFLSDLVMLYRCFMVWNFNKWIIIFPTLTWLASGACNFYVVWLNTAPPAIYNTGFAWGSAAFALSFATNVFVTLAIVIRIWRLRSELAATLGWQHAKTYTSVIAMIVESAAIYAVTMLIFICNFATDSPATGMLLYIVSQVQSLAPMLVIVRVGLGRSASEYTTQQSGSIGSKISPRSIRLHTTTDTFVESRSGTKSNRDLDAYAEKSGRSVESV